MWYRDGVMAVGGSELRDGDGEEFKCLELESNFLF